MEAGSALIGALWTGSKAVYGAATTKEDPNNPNAQQKK